MYVIAEMIDAVFGHKRSDAPLRNGPMRPDPRLDVDATDRSGPFPILIGRMPEGVTLHPAITAISEQEYHSRIGAIQEEPIEMDPEDIKKARRQNMVVTRLQARRALREFGLLETVESMSNDPGSDDLFRDAWLEASEWRRLSPTMLAMAAQLGIDDEQLDVIFERAMEITNL